MGKNTEILDKLFKDMPSEPDGTEVELAHFFGSGTCIRRSLIKAGFIGRVHTHGYSHLSVVGYGCGTLLKEDETVELRSGDVIEVPAGMRHAYVAKADTLWLCVHGTHEQEAQKLYGGSNVR